MVMIIMITAYTIRKVSIYFHYDKESSLYDVRCGIKLRLCKTLMTRNRNQNEVTGNGIILGRYGELHTSRHLRGLFNFSAVMMRKTLCWKLTLNMYIV